MRTNEAPEKIYIQPDAQDGWFMVNNLNNTLVEYTRTDAFIEKACDTIKDLLGGYVIRNFHFGDSYDMDKLIDDFIKETKGE